MVTPELLDFLRVQLSSGMSKETLTELLLREGGWSKADVEEAFAALTGIVHDGARLPAVIAMKTELAPLEKESRGDAPAVAEENHTTPQQPAAISHVEQTEKTSPVASGLEKQTPDTVARKVVAVHVTKEEDFLGIFAHDEPSTSGPQFLKPREAVQPASVQKTAPEVVIRTAPKLPSERKEPFSAATMFGGKVVAPGGAQTMQKPMTIAPQVVELASLNGRVPPPPPPPPSRPAEEKKPFTTFTTQSPIVEGEKRKQQLAPLPVIEKATSKLQVSFPANTPPAIPASYTNFPKSDRISNIAPPLRTYFEALESAKNGAAQSNPNKPSEKISTPKPPIVEQPSTPRAASFGTKLVVVEHSYEQAEKESHPEPILAAPEQPQAKHEFDDVSTPPPTPPTEVLQQVTQLPPHPVLQHEAVEPPPSPPQDPVSDVSTFSPSATIPPLESLPQVTELPTQPTPQPEAVEPPPPPPPPPTPVSDSIQEALPKVLERAREDEQTILNNEAPEAPEEESSARFSFDNISKGEFSHSSADTVTADTRDEKGASPLRKLTSGIFSASKEHTAASPKQSVNTRKVMYGLVALILVISVGFIGFLLYRKYVSPSPSLALASSFTKLTQLSSVGVRTQLNSTLQFDGSQVGGSKGKLTAAIFLEGNSKISSEGIGDGSHRFTVDAAIESQTVKWATKLEGNLIVVGSDFYVKINTPPRSDGSSAQVLKDNWIKIDTAQLLKEIALQGGEQSAQYGDFAGKRSSTFSMLSNNFPFTGGGAGKRESVLGKDAYRYPLTVDGEKALALTREIYSTFTGKQLTVSEDEKLRFIAAMQKATVELWVDSVTGDIMKLTFSLTPDDILFGIATKGSIVFELNFQQQNMPLSVIVPAPYLTLDEVRATMLQSDAEKAVRAGDALRVEAVSSLEGAISEYAKKKGRVPQLLSDLRSEALLPALASTTPLSSFVYYPYKSTTTLSKSGRCGLNDKKCNYYHIGVNLDEETSPFLTNDADKTAEIKGSDKGGCGSERAVYCYDKIVEVRSDVAVTMSTSTPQ